MLCFNIFSVSADTYGPVKAGDILWNIAAKVSPRQDLSRYQVMLSLLKHNPHAFSVSCNVNSLKTGQILQVPSIEFIQATSAQQATEIINKQFEAWNNRRNIPIVCEPPETQQDISEVNIIPTLATQSIQTAKPIQTIEPTQTGEPTQTIEPSHSDEPQSEAQKDEAQLIEKPQIKQEMTVESPPTKSENENQTLLQYITSKDDLLITIAGILVIFTLLLIIILIWFIYKLANRKESIADEQYSTVFSRVYEQPQTKPKNTDGNDIKDKLAVIRTCLAEGEEAVQVLLKDVLEKGSDDQQHEARQLIEINRKIHQLEQHKQDDVADMSQYLPQNSFTPENKQQMFTLIDKIFELLDHELNANGKLIEAYTQRHQTDFFDQSPRPEKVLVEKNAGTHHSTEKATRYL
jgi:FimV-like protein